MLLRTKVMGLVIAVFIAYGAFDYGVQRLFILPSFQTLEREEALKDMERVLQTIERELNLLLATASDWAAWDDTYQFVVDGNEAYREANLNLKAVQNVKCDVLYFFDVDRRPVWGIAYDPIRDAATTLPELSGERLPADHPLSARPETTWETKGILKTMHGPVLVGARPILTNNREGPVRGSLVFGRYLQSDALAQQARVQLATTILGEEARPTTEEANILSELGNKAESVIRAGDGIDRVYRVLPDIHGQPALLLRVDVPKAISARGEAAIRYAMLSLLGAGLLILAVLLIGLRHLVLNPLHRLTGHVVAVGQRDDLSAHLDLNRGDELGVLAREFKRMFERLAEARRRLVDQSFKSGLAEMASGVLHNIGNAMTPLKVRVATLDQAVRQAPSADLRLALAELAGGDTPLERRRDLEQFAILAGREVADVLDKTAEQLVGVAGQVDHVQKILGDQERFSRAARVLEPVPVDVLVRESVDLLGDGLRQGIHLELDPALGDIGAVLGSRVALQQVMINLLKNAAEAIRENGALAPGGGFIIVDARAEASDGHAVVHLRVMDNGVGILPEHLPHVFERGFSTKSRPSSGLGLHWSAVTVAAMNGQLHADSAGPGQGACLHLVMPLAEARRMALAEAHGG